MERSLYSPNLSKLALPSCLSHTPRLYEARFIFAVLFILPMLFNCLCSSRSRSLSMPSIDSGALFFFCYLDVTPPPPSPPLGSLSRTLQHTLDGACAALVSICNHPSMDQSIGPSPPIDQFSHRKTHHYIHPSPHHLSLTAYHLCRLISHLGFDAADAAETTDFLSSGLKES